MKVYRIFRDSHQLLLSRCRNSAKIDFELHQFMCRKFVRIFAFQKELNRFSSRFYPIPADEVSTRWSTEIMHRRRYNRFEIGEIDGNFILKYFLDSTKSHGEFCRMHFFEKILNRWISEANGIMLETAWNRWKRPDPRSRRESFTYLNPACRIGKD